MRDIAIYGAGGFGRETALLIRQINQVSQTWNLIGFFDDNAMKDSTIDGLPVLGGMKEVNEVNKSTSIVIAIANGQIRQRLHQSVQNKFIDFPSLIHPSVMLGDQTTNRIGEGCILTASCILTTNVILDAFVIINLASTLGHDVHLKSYSSIMPQCSISGFVTIGERTYIGVGARLLPGLNIGPDVNVGAGAVVTKSIADSLTVAGVPAKELVKR